MAGMLQDDVMQQPHMMGEEENQENLNGHANGGLTNGHSSSGHHHHHNHDDVEGKIFVGGLSWQTTEESMRFHFEKFGELSDIAIMIDKRTGQPRGFGFITMKDPAAADIVVSTEHTIDGRVVDVKRAVPRDMAPAPTRAESKKIFVGGLPTEVTEKEFEEYFGTFGLVKVRPFSSSYAGWKAQQRGTD
jgi:hypothetical protein